MRRNKLAMYVHLIWATWNRLPLIKPEVDNIKQYVQRQKEHHVTGELRQEFEESFEEFEITQSGNAASA